MQPREALLGLMRQGRYDDALAQLAHWPPGPERAWLAGSCHLRRGDYRDAEHLLAGLARDPQAPSGVRLRLGLARHGQNRLEQAMACYLPLVAGPFSEDGADDALVQYGLACLELGLGAHWLQLLEKLPAAATAIPRLRYLRGLARLAEGDFAAGWLDHEQRFAAACSNLPPLPLPIWQGEPLAAGSQLLLLCEQGLGDGIQFLRFAPLLRPQFARITLLAPKPLRRLVEASGLVDAVISSADPLPEGLSHALPLMSVPHRLGLDQPSTFRPEPYLRVQPAEAELWRRRLGADGAAGRAPLIALNWQGNRAGEGPSAVNRERSVPLAVLERLTALQGARLIAVQVGPEAQAIQGSALASALVPAQAAFSQGSPDLHTTAAVLASCDLLISNDTSIAHLGGALGVPTWLMLKAHPSWQWGDHADTTPWYSSVRCFRQLRPFHWEGLIEPLNQALLEWRSHRIQPIHVVDPSRRLRVLHLLAKDPVIFHLFALELKAVYDRLRAEPDQAWAALIPASFAGSWRHRALEGLLPVFTDPAALPAGHELLPFGPEQLQPQREESWLVAPHRFLRYDPCPVARELVARIQRHHGLQPGFARECVLIQRRDSRVLHAAETGEPLEHWLGPRLEAAGIPWRRVVFEELEPLEQWRAMAAARMLVGVHGSGLTNLVFTPPTCQVLEIDFRRHWQCDPLCEGHRSGRLALHQPCGAVRRHRPGFHKADYHNLCGLFGRPYESLSVESASGFRSANPIDATQVSVSGEAVLEMVRSRFALVVF